MEIIKEWLYKKSLKHQMIEVFQKAGLYIEHQTRGGKVPIYLKFMQLLLRTNVYNMCSPFRMD